MGIEVWRTPIDQVPTKIEVRSVEDYEMFCQNYGCTCSWRCAPDQVMEAEVTNEYIMEAEVMEEKVDIYNKEEEKLNKTERVTVLTVAMKIGKTDVNIRTANGVLHTVPWKMWDNHFKLLGPYYSNSDQYRAKDFKIPEGSNAKRDVAKRDYKKKMDAQSKYSEIYAKTFVDMPDQV